LIMQNGYELDYADLSGGEKTSLALAYRLALNQVINTLVGNIKTKSLIILDEPTDGFSEQQLDKMREVLDSLNTRQTIIVSHDPKIESFVDNVVRISKHEHISTIK
ncbi:MAG: AAA family ATPase, partial [Candidatus Woesearchaeota archaeon]